MAVASREIEERRLWLVAMLAFTVVQVALLMTRAFDVLTRDTIAGGIAVAVPCGVAIALGSSVIAGDLGEGRLGFYFSRPMSGLAIWGGKMLGALVLTAVAVALVAGPVIWANADLPGGVHTAAVIAPLLLIVSAHAVASALRSRSRLLPVDLVVAVVLAGAAALIFQRLVAAGAHETLFVLGPWMVGVLILSLLVAGLAQVVYGRSDPRRGHVVLSWVLWSTLALGVLGFAGFARWVLAVTPAEVGFWAMEVPSRGETFRLKSAGASFAGQGRARFAPSFWVNAATGAWARDARSAWHRFSSDGRRIFWLEDAPPRLGMASADSFPPQGSAVALASDPGWLIAVSPEGDQVVTQSRDQIHVIETATGRVVGSTSASYTTTVVFLGGGTLRVFEHEYGVSRNEPALRVTDWRPQTGALKALLSSRERLHTVEPASGRAIVFASDGAQTTFRLVDPSNGGSLLLPSGTRAATFLASGTVAAVGYGDGQVWVTEVREGAKTGAKTLLGAFAPTGAQVRESAPGVVSVQPWGAEDDSWLMAPEDPELENLPLGRGLYVVDLAGARVLRHESDLRFVERSFNPRVGDPAGSLRTRLMTDDCGSLLTVEPLTGVRHALFPCAAAPWFPN
jgi:hypothetical protein